jgi:hypothetical protein
METTKAARSRVAALRTSLLEFGNLLRREWPPSVQRQLGIMHGDRGIGRTSRVVAPRNR